MKKHFTIKLISVFLATLMIFLMIPFSSLHIVATDGDDWWMGGIGPGDSDDTESGDEDETEDPSLEDPYSTGLKFTLNDDGISYSVTDIGSCSDSDLLIPPTYEGKPVTSIKDKAFMACHILWCVTIPESVTYIGDQAFKDCSSLYELSIPDSVTYVGKDAFANTLIIETENGVSYVDNWAIGCDSSITDLELRSGTVGISESAFQSCSSLVSVSIPGSVTNIGACAFLLCTNLTTVNIGDGATIIGAHMFYGCTKLVSLDLPQSITNIGDNALWGCTGLTTIVVPNNVNSIGWYAFEGCSNVEAIIYCRTQEEWNKITKGNLWDASVGSATADGIYTLKYHAWDDGEITAEPTVTSDGTKVYTCSACKETRSETLPKKEFSENLKFTLNDDGCSYSVKGLGACDDTYIIIPSTYEGKPVTSVADWTFLDCDKITHVSIPDTVTSIGYAAFYNCSSLESIKMSKIMASIDDYAFMYCTNLKSITFPDTVTVIGYSAFTGCSDLSDIEFGENSRLQIIGDNAFSRCSSLESVTIPNSVKSIGNNVFLYCSSLTEITVEKNNEKYSSLDGNLYNKNQTILIQYAIGKNEISFVIPEGVTSIKDNAFSGCSNLESIYIPDGITSIGNSVFINCSNLTSISVDTNSAHYSSLNGNLYNKDKTVLIQYALGKEDTSFTVPSTVEKIGDNSFSSASYLTNVSIPDSVKSIGDNAFSDCKSLESFTYYGEKEDWTAIEKGFTWDYNTGIETENGVYEVIYGVKYILGDVNDDGAVDSDDALQLLRYTLMPDRFPINQDGDMNGDGVVDSDDALQLLRYTLMPDRYPLS